MPKITRTIEDCKIVALKYNARVKFKRNNSAVYYYARARGWLDEICEHMLPLNESRTIEDCEVVAKKYSSRIEFCRNDSKIYYYARSYGWLDIICRHMTPYFVFNRTKEQCHELALKYSRPVDFLREHGSAYKKAQKEGWLEDILSHMTYFNPTTNIVYAWKIKDSDIWKIGVSNEFCVEERIKNVSRLHKVVVEKVLYKKIEKNARLIENNLLSLGSKIEMPDKQTGWTEFRKLSYEDVIELTNYFMGEYCD
jgi:hypothetical protein